MRAMYFQSTYLDCKVSQQYDKRMRQQYVATQLKEPGHNPIKEIES